MAISGNVRYRSGTRRCCSLGCLAFYSRSVGYPHCVSNALAIYGPTASAAMHVAEGNARYELMNPKLFFCPCFVVFSGWHFGLQIGTSTVVVFLAFYNQNIFLILLRILMQLGCVNMGSRENKKYDTIKD